MHILYPRIESDFTGCSLKNAIDTMHEDGPNRARYRLILSNVYRQNTICEVIFYATGALNIPFEISYALPADAWILICADDNSMLVNPGA